MNALSNDRSDSVQICGRPTSQSNEKEGILLFEAEMRRPMKSLTVMEFTDDMPFLIYSEYSDV